MKQMSVTVTLVGSELARKNRVALIEALNPGLKKKRAKGSKKKSPLSKNNP